MAKSGMNLQDSFLNQVRKDGVEVKVCLVNGTMLRGFVRGFDNFTIVVHAGGSQHLIYKHAIAELITKKMARPDDKPQPGEADDASAPEPKSEPFNKLDLSGLQTQPESTPQAD